MKSTSRKHSALLTNSAIKALKSLIPLPTEHVEATPLVRDACPRALLHHLYSWLLNRASDAEVWRDVKATLDVYDETAKPTDDGAAVVTRLMRAVGERMAVKM